MPYDKFLIGYNDNNSGIQSNVKPWLITDNAFETLENVYVLRGRVRKRFGTVYMGSSALDSRFSINIGTTDSSGDLSVTVPGSIFAIGQMFSCISDDETDMFTVYQTGTPGTCLSLTTATCTYNTSTGDVVITGASVTTDVYFYPSTPVMGLTQYYDQTTNTYSNIGFDTQFSYQFDQGSTIWTQISSGDYTWTGTDYDFFWMTNYIGSADSATFLWVTNFNTADGIRYFDGTTWYTPILNWTKGSSIDTTDSSGDASGTVSGGSGFIGQEFTIAVTSFTVTASSGALTPTSNSTAGPTGTGTFDTTTGDYTFTGATPNSTIYFTGDNYIETARIIVQFKNRLILLNTVELVDDVSTNFPFRCRYSSLFSPINPPAWMQDFSGNGGFVDASTQESIITAQFVKDRLIVYFTSSTFELVYTNNQVQPFIWQKINNELGAISTFSEIPFDKVTLGIDDTGIHACNGANVDRIDNKIPQFPFNMSNEEEGQDRVAGIRDFYNEMAYWTYATNNRSDSFYFPNKILVYNYINESWATIDDSFTTFGYFYQLPTSTGLTWGNTSIPWGDNLNLWNFAGTGYNNTTVKTIIAGNQQGFVSILQPDVSSSTGALQITNFTSSAKGTATVSCINHNLGLNQYVLLSNMNGMTFTDSKGQVLSELMCRVTPDPVIANTPNSFSILSIDNYSVPVTIAGTYTGGGVASLVSNIGILTKQYNFYTEQDRNMYLSRVDFLVDKTDNGQITADYLTSSTNISLVNEGLGSLISPGPLPGNSVLETSPYALSNFEQFQSRLWHPIYMYAEGECVQLQMYLSPNQMYSYEVNCDSTISYTALSDFQLHAMVFYVTATSYRMQ